MKEVLYSFLKKVWDTKNVCPICGKEKQDFEKKRISFSRHIHLEHDIWKYVYFLIYMRLKDSQEYNGIEDQIQRMNSQDKLSWMPDMRTVYLCKYSIGKDYSVWG